MGAQVLCALLELEMSVGAERSTRSMTMGWVEEMAR
jgi:hypothetical protein